MRLVKLIVTLVIVGFIALFIGQNLKAWTGPVSFNLDFWVLGKTEWNLELWVIILIAALIGFLLGAILLLKPYFKVRRALARERQDKKAAAQAEILPAKDDQAQASQA
jgi:uncharacterized integral membrane protein